MVVDRFEIGFVAQLDAVMTTLWLGQFLDFKLIPAAGLVSSCGCFRALVGLNCALGAGDLALTLPISMDESHVSYPLASPTNLYKRRSRRGWRLFLVDSTKCQ